MRIAKKMYEVQHNHLVDMRRRGELQMEIVVLFCLFTGIIINVTKLIK